MFLKPGTLNALMKKAYKSGLAVGRTEDDWLLSEIQERRTSP